MFQIIGKTYEVPREPLEKVAQAAFSFLGLKDAEVELKFVSKSEITRLNAVYRNKERPTDVLSFVIDEKPLLGQIFICYTFTKKQAVEMGKSLTDEVSLLLVHGILHLAGYDHENAAEASDMESQEIAILNKVGVNR